MADDVSFVQEIDDSIRADRLEQFWLRSGKAIIVLFVIVLILTIGWVVWKNHNEQALADETHAILQAKTLSDAGKNAEAAHMLETLTIHSPNLAALKGLRLAEAELAAGDTEKARAAYALTAALSGADPTLRDYAAVQAGILAQNGNSPTDFKGAGDAGRPYAPMVSELKAAALLSEGKKDEARIILQSLADTRTLAASQHSRVMELLNAAGGEPQ